MKNILKITTLIFIFGCNPKIEPNVNQSKSEITYWKTDYDTITETNEINIENETYHLNTKTYCLNDSSIVKKSDNITFIYHNYISELTLKKGNFIVLKSQINKEIFKDSLDNDFYRHSILKNIKFNFVRSNRLYFKSKFNLPETDWIIESDFAIFFRTNKKGKINYWNVKSIN